MAFDLTEHRASAEDAALYSRHNDEQDFAENIAILMDNPELREKMGAYGRAEEWKNDWLGTIRKKTYCKFMRTSGLTPAKRTAADAESVETSPKSETTGRSQTTGAEKVANSNH